MFGYPMASPWNHVFYTPGRVAVLNVIVVIIVIWLIMTLVRHALQSIKKEYDARRSWESYLYYQHYHWRRYSREMAREMDQASRNDET
jgi:hypothetical protein